MEHFAGLDVSVKDTSVCIVGDTGKPRDRCDEIRPENWPYRSTREIGFNCATVSSDTEAMK